MEKICKNCLLYNQNDSVCSVTVLIEGEKYELPVLPYDECHWEKLDTEIQTEMQIRSQLNGRFKEELEVPIEIKQIRVWSDGKNGYIES